MNVPSLSGAEYFLTFVDERTRYVWVYVLKHKDEVFDKFFEWKALVEKSTGQKLKALCIDNGREYMSTKFENYLKTEGVRHEHTIPKTGSQITGKNQKLIATATKIGNLYHLNCHTSSHNINAAEDRNQETKENMWDQRFGHLGTHYLQKLAKEKLVDAFNYNISKEIDFCESCAKGKHHRSKFPNNSCKQTRFSTQ